MKKDAHILLFSISEMMILFLLVVTIGCGSGPYQGQSKLGKNDLCRDIAARYDAVLAGRKDTCLNNSDCLCYQPVSENSGCGGITDKATAEKLAKLGKEFHNAGCDWEIECAPWLCEPVCVKGRCDNKE